jgi:hypothetical protein
MAVSNGSITGEEQILGNYGRVQFNFDFDPSGPGDFDSTLRSFNQFGGDIQYSRNHIGRGVISSETITMTLPFPNFENGPGGYRTTYRTVQQSITNGLEERCEDGLPDWCGEVPFGNIIGDGRHTFIPLASALDLDVDIKTREGVFAVPAPNVRSPFDALYTTPKNTEHVDLNAFYGPLLYEIGAEFQRTIYVDWDHPGEELGTPANPFRTVTRAHDFAWNGVTINIQSGVYPENVIFLKRVTVVTTGGLVTIGR